MIVRPMQSWFRMLFIWNGSVLQTIIPQLLVMGILSTLAVLTHGRVFGEKIPLSPVPFTLFGLTLAIFLVFRNNASYARFVEARLLWGNLLIASRTLTSQLLSYLPAQARLADSIIATAYALKHQLRRTDPNPDLVRLLGAERAKDLHHKLYRPVVLLNEIRAHLEATSETTRWMLDAQLNDLERCVGGCERIASTPIPFAYSVLLHRSVYAYCVLLPFGLVDSTEFFTPLLCVFISYTLIALEAIANEVAEPFGMAPNALALDAMARTIERSVLELCGRQVPEEVRPTGPYQLT
ncbi:bestrophin family protein [Pseudoduganella sp. UC29_106]|uniref:bestrophin family protein n=1 Tax=Pseudoduganella sp. UC29_106 TaxID=3374553 RepID=UPI003757CF06